MKFSKVKQVKIEYFFIFFVFYIMSIPNYYQNQRFKES